MEIKRKEGESVNSVIFRFMKKTQQSGVLREAKKRRFRTRAANRLKMKLSALHRYRKQKEFQRARKWGLV